MNASGSVSQFQPSSEAAHFKPSDPSDSSSNGVGGGDFSTALHEADNKPHEADNKTARKNAASRDGQDTQGGSQLPAGGNTPPTLPPAPIVPPVQNAPTVPPPAGAGAPVVITTTASGIAPASPALPPTGSGSQNANSTPAAAAGDTATPLPQPVIQAAAITPHVLPPNLSAATDSTGADGAAPNAAAVNDASTPAAAATSAEAEAAAAAAAAASSAAAAAQKSAGALAAAAPTVNQVSAQPSAASQGKAASPLQGNQPTHTVRETSPQLAASTASTSSSGDATAAADTAAQTAVAAAEAVAARAGNASDSDDPASQDQMATPDTGPKAAVAAAPAVAAPVAAALAGAHAIAAATAATTAANERTIMDLAHVNAGITDKTSHDNNPDISLTAVSTDGSLGAAQLISSAPTADASPPATFKITPPVETADFSQGVADRVSFMVDGDISSAKLQVNPPALGPIEVRIALQGAHAQVSFTSHSALTRDALESSAPKLREMLGAQGFGQVSVDVSQGSYQDRSAQSSPYRASGAGARDGSVDAVQSASRSSARIATGVLDAYA